MGKYKNFLNILLIAGYSGLTMASGVGFVEKSVEVGLNYQHRITPAHFGNLPIIMGGGMAIGDVNGDGWEDIFVSTGALVDVNGVNLTPNKLLISDGQGNFTDQTAAFNLNPQDMYSSGPLIADIDGDGLRDLIIGGVSPEGLVNTGWVRLYKNNANSGFVDISAGSGLPHTDNYSTTAADIDGDGDLDLAFSHWGYTNDKLLWENNGVGVFSDATNQWLAVENPFSFTISFDHLNNDQNIDMMVASDYGFSNYYRSTGHSMITQDPSVLTDEHGMGASVGDFDNDGDMDWFVTSIYLAGGGRTGNRLYQNDGNGGFTDISETAGVQDGGWGWGSCFADFNNDGFLDIYHVNGYPDVDFNTDRARLFINSGDGTFVDRAQELNVDDGGMGRAVLCFDQNRDGKIDILINNNDQMSAFYQNNIATTNHYLLVKLQGGIDNIDAVGAKIEATINGSTTLTRTVSLGNNYLSTEPTMQHFGLGAASIIDTLKVTWPDGTINNYLNVPADQFLVLTPVDEIFIDGFE